MRSAAVPPPSGDRAPLAQTLSLRPCLAHLGEGSTVVSFDDASGAPRLGAVHAPSCPSSDLELVVVERAGAGTLVTDDLAGAPVLPLGGSRSLTLAAGLRSAGIYLRTTGAPLALLIRKAALRRAAAPNAASTRARLAGVSSTASAASVVPPFEVTAARCAARSLSAWASWPLP